jgi:hypothetical protein
MHTRSLAFLGTVALTIVCATALLAAPLESPIWPNLLSSLPFWETPSGSHTGPDEDPVSGLESSRRALSLDAPSASASSSPGTRTRAIPIVKAIYLTSWSAATPSRLTQAIGLISDTELNAVVIDIKDYSGKVVFETSNPIINSVGSEERRLDLAGLVQRFHANGIYVIVRIAVFQDQHLIKVSPHLAVRDTHGRIWRDRKGLGWVDPASTEVWQYVVEVSREAARAGVDELNFDYIRFPSDGNLSAIRYPMFDPRTQTRREVLQQFFAYLTTELRAAGPVLSADLFGLTTVREDDLGIGQVVEDALLFFDVVAPMVYPSHYARGFLGYKNPAAHPYEVVSYSLIQAQRRRQSLVEAIAAIDEGDEGHGAAYQIGQIRPWLQAFDLGAPYPPRTIRTQMQAVSDAGLSAGWLLWSPSNRYQPASFKSQ